jgi:hypothetical protein
MTILEKTLNIQINSKKIKPAIVPALSLLFICADVEGKNKVTISEETHLNILSVLDNMN